MPPSLGLTCDETTKPPTWAEIRARGRRARALRLAGVASLLAIAVIIGWSVAWREHANNPDQLRADEVNGFWASISFVVAAAEALVVGAVVLLQSRRSAWVKAVGYLGALAGLALLGLLTLLLYFAYLTDH